MSNHLARSSGMLRRTRTYVKLAEPTLGFSHGRCPLFRHNGRPFKRTRHPLHIVRQLENAEACSDSELRRWYLSFVIVGAGFSGVEVDGEINELVRSSTRFYRNFSKDDINVSLLHSQDQILPEVAPRLREFARMKMGQAGVTVLLNTRAVVATHEGVGLQDGRLLRGATIVMYDRNDDFHRRSAS